MAFVGVTSQLEICFGVERKKGKDYLGIQIGDERNGV